MSAVYDLFASLPRFRARSDGSCVASCPCTAHINGDRNPSLSIKHVDGKWLLHCFGGCDLTAILDALGITARDLRDDHDEVGAKPGGSRTNGNGTRDRIAATYRYVDEHGKLLFESVRFEPKGREKYFRQRRPNGNGWTWDLKGVHPVLYRLPELLHATSEEVWIAEGEKCVDAVRALGMTATTAPMGANAPWLAQYTASFKPEHRVVLLQDNDTPGKIYTQKAAKELYGKVASLKILELPNLPPKGDVVDWLRDGDRENPAEVLSLLAEVCEEWKPEHGETTGDDPGAMQFTKLGDLLNEPAETVRWIVEGLLPASGDSLLVAKPKVGKSTLARCLALSVSRGETFLGLGTTQGPVFYLALEEKRSEVRAHFRAMGAREDDPIHIFCSRSPDDGLAQLRKAVTSTKPVLVIVDPLFRFVRMKDGNDYAAVTNALEPLHALARETGSHVLVVHHMGKGDRQGGDAILGSTALLAAVDTAMMMKRSDKYRTLSSIQRYGTDLDEITLDYDDETRTLSSGLPRAEADQTEAAAAIIEFLSSQIDAVEEGLIHESIEGRKAVKVKALRKAVKDGRIQRTGNGKRKDPYQYSVVCPDSGSLVPTYIGEPEKQESQNPASRSPECADAGSRLFAGSKPDSEVREQANSATEQEIVTGFGNYAALAKTNRKEVL